jgi:hypothetical protein
MLATCLIAGIVVATPQGVPRRSLRILGRVASGMLGALEPALAML